MSDDSSALRLHTAGLIAVVVGALVFVAAVGLLDWLELPKLVEVGNTRSVVSHGAALWDVPGNQAGVLTVIALGTAGFAGAGLLSTSVLTTLPTVCDAFYLLGQAFPIGGGYGDYQVGFWVATAAALAVAIGSVVALLGATRFAARNSGSP
jgi:hypothetical protein